VTTIALATIAIAAIRRSFLPTFNFIATSWLNLVIAAWVYQRRMCRERGGPFWGHRSQGISSTVFRHFSIS
jgi:hypothetical protein